MKQHLPLISYEIERFFPYFYPFCQVATLGRVAVALGNRKPLSAFLVSFFSLILLSSCVRASVANSPPGPKSGS